jgi:hypothetical protein
MSNGAVGSSVTATSCDRRQVARLGGAMLGVFGLVSVDAQMFDVALPELHASLGGAWTAARPDRVRVTDNAAADVTWTASGVLNTFPQLGVAGIGAMIPGYAAFTDDLRILPAAAVRSSTAPSH